MASIDLLIRGETVFGTSEGGAGEPRAASLAVSGGKIDAILSPDAPCDATEVFDATGLYVSPGFVDTHMHDEYFEDPDTVQQALIKQGVTTAIGGHCGMGPPLAKSLAERKKPWLHLSYMVGNCYLREAVGHKDRYTNATEAEIAAMCDLLKEAFDAGAMGLSYGLEYAPGTSKAEVDALAEIAAGYGDRIVSIHIRYDDRRCLDAVREAITISREHGIRVQISHLGSMTMTHTQECIDLIEAGMREGIDLAFDCYPYAAFCAKAGSAVYDDGYKERWNGKGPECLEAATGRFKGQRLTDETLAIMRKEEPMGLIVAHVMNEDEIRNCLRHPDCVVASDALYTGGGAHPRIAGTFPRAIGILREGGYSWERALYKTTALPADTMRLPAGRLLPGRTADIVIFAPETFRDRATFQDPFAEPEGVKLVVVGGKVVLRDGKMAGGPQGDFFVRER